MSDHEGGPSAEIDHVAASLSTCLLVHGVMTVLRLTERDRLAYFTKCT